MVTDPGCVSVADPGCVGVADPGCVVDRLKVTLLAKIAGLQ